MAKRAYLAKSDETAVSPLSARDDDSISTAEFQASFGEDIRHTLNLDTWRVGADLSQEYTRIETEVREAVDCENAIQKDVRDRVFPVLLNHPNGPANAGVYQADPEAIKKIHNDLLFRGGMEACDGAIQVYDTLPLTIYQIGVAQVSYQGDQGTYCQRLFRRDLRQSFPDPADEAIAMLNRRSNRSNSAADALGELARKAILAYAERAILLRRCKAPWRMGHGNPVPYELLTGGNCIELMVEATNVLRELVEQHQKFVFVASEPQDRLLLTIAHSLRPMEYGIVSTLDERLELWLHQRRFTVRVSPGLLWDEEEISPPEWIPRFIERVASKIVVGVFRASKVAPAQVFYAHVDHADYAAHMALADSVLQDHRGFPLLTDLARNLCRTVFGETLDRLAESAYAAAGVPWRYFSE